MTTLDKAMNMCDVGRGYEQYVREVKGLLGNAKEITTKINRLSSNINSISKDIMNDNSLSVAQIKELSRMLTEAENYIGNNSNI